MRDPVTSASLPFSTTCRTTMSQHSSGSQHKAVTEDERLLASPSRERRAFTKTDSWRVVPVFRGVAATVVTLFVVSKEDSIFRTDCPALPMALYPVSVVAPRIHAWPSVPALC